MMEGLNRSIKRTHGSTLVIFARLWIYTPRIGMRKFEIAQAYYAEDEFLLEIILFSITKCFNLPVDIFGHELRQERMEWRALS